MADNAPRPGLPGGFPLFTIFGFRVRLNLSWLLLGLLITWTLAEGLFPSQYPDLSREVRWWMGAAGALGILVSIVFHELSHSLVGRHYGLPIGGITLFVFGGIAEMRQEPKNPKTEFLMAAAGPLSSLALACVFRVIEALGTGWPDPVIGVIHYLAVINVVLAVFNLVPAYPLDGGRMLRAALWHWRSNVEEATRMASRGGEFFGIMLMVLGALSALTGNLIGGIWMFLIGSFVRGAARVSYQQLLMRRFLEGRTVGDLMEEAPAAVSPSTSLTDFLERYAYRRPHRVYPVADDGKLLGLIRVQAVKHVPEAERASKTVGDVMSECAEPDCVTADEDATELLEAMLSAGATPRKFVVDGGRLLGAISINDLREQLALRLEMQDKTT